MTARDMLNEYIKASRRTRKTLAALVKQYDDFHRRLDACATYALECALPELIVTYSIERRCELLRIGGEAFLVYDQYLGQTMNLLNRILFNATTGRAAEMCAAKYLAEKLLVCQQPKAAYVFALLYEKLRAAAALGCDRSIKERAGFTEIQERYAIAHESAHYLFHTNSQFRDVHSHSAGRIVEELLESASREMVVAVVRAHGTWHLEEIACDQFALFLCTQVAERQLGMSVTEVFRAIAVGMQHLEVFRHLDSLVPVVVSGERRDDHEGSLVRLRQNALRQTMLYAFAPPNARRESDWQAVNGAITDALNDYETIVARPIRQDFTHKVFRLRADYGEQLAADSASAAEFASEVDRLTGWTAERASV